ncbi:MAG: hypothetical protein MRERV_36c002 [Mycoplasmataceae bacterium RV_VA103A]|nr:MAG: hypothetical protein MRERV_36c002 [Mycoplasmataceae bacterium RV_VA103A]
MVNINNTLNELKDILTTIKTKQDANTAWTGSEKADIEKRIAHVYDKSKPRHTNLSADLEIDLKDLENIDKTIGQEKIKTDAEIKKLTDEKSQLQTDITAKDALIKQKDEQIGGKITKDLIDKLEAVSKLDLKKQAKKDKDGNDLKDSQGNIIYEEIVDLSPLKTLLEELKTKGISTDLSTTNGKIDEVKTKVEAIKPGGSEKNYWSIGACIGSGIAVLLLGYVAFLKPTPDINVYEEKAKKEVDL